MKTFANNIKATPAEKEIIIDFNNGTLSLTAQKRLELFRYAKFITQTYKAFQTLSNGHIDSRLIKKFEIKKVKRTKFYTRNSLEENKIIYEEIRKLIQQDHPLPAEELQTLYLLNSIYSLRFFNLLNHIAPKHYEKSAFLFLAKRNYKDKILFNHKIFGSEKFIIKEFDALITRSDKNNEITLVEAKYQLCKNSFRQIFGYNNPGGRISHKDVFTDREICSYNKLTNPIKRVEIIYNNINPKIIKDYKLGRYIAEHTKRFSLDISRDDFVELCQKDIEHYKTVDYPLVNEKNLIDLLCSEIEEITFTRLNSAKVDMKKYCLNQFILKEYHYLFI